MKKQKEGTGGARKVGRNKIRCEFYRTTNMREKNKIKKMVAYHFSLIKKGLKKRNIKFNDNELFSLKESIRKLVRFRPERKAWGITKIEMRSLRQKNFSY